MCYCVLPVENWKNDLLLGLVNRYYLFFRENQIPRIEPLPCNEINGALLAVFQLNVVCFDFTFAKQFIHRGFNFIYMMYNR